jgi:hypothetical protein
MKRFVVLFALALGGCAQGLLASDPVDPQQMAASEAASDAALDAVISCTEPKVPSYSQTPDAAPDVAAAIVGACNSQVAAYSGSVERTCLIKLRGNQHAASACASLNRGIRADLQNDIATRVVQQRAKVAGR